MLAVIKKELRGYFLSPLGYVFLAIVVLFSGWFLKDDVLMKASSDFSILFGSMFTINMFIIPILTMRLMSEDKKQKTDQLLWTAPVSPLSIIMGKYISASIMYIVSHLVYVFEALWVSAQSGSYGFDWNIFFTSCTGSILLGIAFISIGLLISSITDSQVVAAVSTFTASMVMMLISTLTIESEWLLTAVNWISFTSRYKSFLIGMFNYSDVVYFLSVIAVCIFFTARLQEKKRWS